MFGSALNSLKKIHGKPVVFYELVSSTPNRVTRTTQSTYKLHYVSKAVVVPKTFISTDPNVRSKDLGFYTRLRGELYVKRSDISFSPDRLTAVSLDGERLEVRQYITDATDYYMFFLAGYTEDDDFTGTFQLTLTDEVILDDGASNS